jgi:transcriptional regulator with XRE-family HTH domain
VPVPIRGKFSSPVTEKTIGQRLAAIRQQRGLTQLELASKLGITQTLVSEYERGNLRLHGALVAAFSKALRSSSDAILGLERVKKDGIIDDRRILRRLQKIEKLGKRDQQALFRTIDAFLAKVS